MQNMDIISVNIWQILISLCNLLLLFLIIKKFLFAPVKKMMAKRQENIDRQYGDAADAKRIADADKEAWEKKMLTVHEEADAIMKTATENAGRRGDKIVAAAKERADGIIREAENEAELERKKATASIKREIADVSALLAEKMLDREINMDDHREMIDSFIEEIGDAHDGDK